MEARLVRAALLAASLLSLGAGYRTQNFLVTASTPHFAQQVAVSAENLRRDLAIEWLGSELPPWPEPCPITVNAAPHLGAGGATSFAFIGGRPTGWTMTIQGSAERVLDSVLPHEITHTIFATHFGRPLPRWADEGACTTVEHVSEKQKQHRLLYEFLTTGRGIAFNQMFAMQEYPPDVLPLYSQGYSLARFLIAQGGKHKYVQYVGDGMRMNNWTKATQSHYGFESLSELQVTWLEWVRRGCPDLPPGVQLASQSGANAADSAGSDQASNQVLVVRGQEPATSGQASALDNQLAAATLASIEPNETSRPGGVSLASAELPARSARGGTSWYARVRDQASTTASNSPAPQAKTHPLHDSVSRALSDGDASRNPQVVTRPQPPEKAQQRVLEWVKKN